MSRLIDAEQLIDKLTYTGYFDEDFEYADELMDIINRIPTVVDIEQSALMNIKRISDEYQNTIEQIKKEFKNEAEMYKVIDRQISGIWYEALHIIEKFVGK